MPVPLGVDIGLPRERQFVIRYVTSVLVHWNSLLA